MGLLDGYHMEEYTQGYLQVRSVSDIKLNIIRYREIDAYSQFGSIRNTLLATLVTSISFQKKYVDTY
jgi:hypothetical protein